MCFFIKVHYILTAFHWLAIQIGFMFCVLSTQFDYIIFRYRKYLFLIIGGVFPGSTAIQSVHARRSEKTYFLSELSHMKKKKKKKTSQNKNIRYEKRWLLVEIGTYNSTIVISVTWLLCANANEKIHRHCWIIHENPWGFL